MRKTVVALLLIAGMLALTGCFQVTTGEESGGTAGTEQTSNGGNASNDNGTDSAVNNQGKVDSGAAESPVAGDGENPGQNREDAVKDVLPKTPQVAADAVMEALRNKDAELLKRYIHPDKGILFAPYVYIDTETARVFSAAELPGMDDATVYNWGSFDGSGEPIRLTFAQYYDRFVYDKDFANAEEIGMDEVKGSGNTQSNIKELYPDSYLVDYYFSGFDPQYEGMDWASLILVLEQKDGGWYIIAAVHNGWTI